MGRVGAAFVAAWLLLYGGNVIWSWGLSTKFLAVVAILAAVVIVVELIFAPVSQVRPRRPGRSVPA